MKSLSLLQSERAHAMRQPPRRRSLNVLICAGTVLLHCAAFYWLMSAKQTPQLLLTAGNPAPAGVRVSLVRAPEPQVTPTQSKEVSEPKPPIKRPQRVEPVQKQVLATKRQDAKRTIDVPVPKETSAQAVQPVTTPTPLVAVTALSRPAAGDPQSTQSALPKAIGASQLKQLGCVIPGPVYPARARRLGREGTVDVALTIDLSGRFQSVHVAHTSGSDELDQAGIDAVSRGRCEPYVEDGVVRTVTATQPIAFSLGN